MNYRNSPARPLKAGERRRTFIDDEGMHWDVCEVKNPDYDRRGGHALLFDSTHAFRRVRNYPEDWFDLSDADLSALSRKA